MRSLKWIILGIIWELFRNENSYTMSFVLQITRIRRSSTDNPQHCIVPLDFFQKIIGNSDISLLNMN